MTEIKAVRLVERFFHFDPDHGAPVSRSFAKGAVVTDPEAIRFLEEHGAAVEPIDNPNSTPIPQRS
jgi:hypothetical protein